MPNLNPVQICAPSMCKEDTETNLSGVMETFFYSNVLKNTSGNRPNNMTHSVGTFIDCLIMITLPTLSVNLNVSICTTRHMNTTSINFWVDTDYTHSNGGIVKLKYMCICLRTQGQGNMKTICSRKLGRGSFRCHKFQAKS